MSKYIALYRRWRPTTFEDVVGQNHITITLKNQITENRIAHAYLFCGTRGTGKTSTAKIFAKAVNCLDSKDGNPCNHCESCKDIDSNNNMDIIEIDAASNNSVDDVRELRDKIKYAPSKGTYKVYIIDEVHMLSSGAFNALLKTLEEPPSHGLFILATTEPHKLPATIISRCQRFDFRRVGKEDMMKRLNHICKHSGVEIEDDALSVIISNSDGAMRDALSILDQCISVVRGKITLEDINNILGIVNNDFIKNFSSSILNRDINSILDYIEELYNSGKDIQNFVKELIGYFRDLMIEKLKDHKQSQALNQILEIINSLSALDGQLRWATQPRILMETSLIKVCNQIQEGSQDIIERIENIEKQLAQGASIPPRVREAEVSYPKAIPAQAAPKKVEDKILNESQSSKPVEDITEAWSKVLEQLKLDAACKAIYSCLEKARPLGLRGTIASIGFDDPSLAFHIAFLETGKNKETVEKKLSSIMGTDIRVEYKMSTDIQETKQDDRFISQMIKKYGDKVQVFEE